MHETERLIDVEWVGNKSVDKRYQVDLEVTGYDRNGLVNEILNLISSLKVPITRVNGHADETKQAKVSLSIMVPNKHELHRAVDRIKQLKDIYSVERIFK